MSDSRVDEYAARLGRWRDEFAALRTILSDTELTEVLKWRKPCYTHGGKNIAIFQPFNEVCALMFFKGALLNDPKALLREQGEASRSSLEPRTADTPRLPGRVGRAHGGKPCVS